MKVEGQYFPPKFKIRKNFFALNQPYMILEKKDNFENSLELSLEKYEISKFIL